ncbi:ABC transporter ATP-binding protein [Aurantimonas sp. VKM B-3413]|uniref:ABC transporter ATP-binding protein n=1 Tax=Aurantimonas sp. VKM B-3413 TaxID=2779401 RepID=UPI001E5AC200|nr:ABC transporter ATP-binding protein [Aurantimonas sp. VKM B-3413]MCB8836393.1 ABC transporter ATP-binding protein [Aurantimonas sp. VKM B-3413]
MATLTLDRVTKRYGKETVLDQVSLSVADGEIVSVFGPSGAGKTVLLRLIAGMAEPEEGAILADGEDLIDIAPEDRAVGMAFQNFALFPHMTAFDNIASPLVAQRLGREKVAEGVHQIAKLLKIDHVLGHAPRALSNGQKQRTALARALVAAPKILLLDDPLRNVDAKLRFEMRLELPRLLQRFGSTVLYVTQDFREAMALGDRIAVLLRGKIAQIGTPEEIYDRPANIEVAELFGDPGINLFEAGVEMIGRHTAAVTGRARLPLPSGFEQAAGRSVTIGVRPEHVGFASEGAEGAFKVRVAALLPLNDRMVRLLVTEDGRELYTSREPDGAAMEEGAHGHVAADPAALIVFDRQSGRRIASRESEFAGPASQENL